MNKIQKVKIFVLLEDIYSCILGTKQEIYAYPYLTTNLCKLINYAYLDITTTIGKSFAVVIA
jgi:hypothetical protein